MATNDYNEPPERRISPKLERFLMTVARREGIKSIKVGLVISFGGKAIILDRNNFLPNADVLDVGLEETIRQVIATIGISEFSDIDYLGSFDYLDETKIDQNNKVKQYNFFIKLPLRPASLREEFKFIDDFDALPELLRPQELRILTLALEKGKSENIEK